MSIMLSQVSDTSKDSYKECNSLKNITFEARNVLIEYLIKDADWRSVNI